MATRTFVIWASLAAAALANYEIISQDYTADPAPFVFNNRIYLITSHDLVSNRDWNMVDYACFSSGDGLNWRDEGIAFTAKQAFPGTQKLWAQQVVFVASKSVFLMAYPGMNGADAGGIGLAVASAPCGPYKDISPGGKAVMPGDDPTLLLDCPSPGKITLCGNNGGGANCSILGDDMVSFEYTPTHFTLTGWFEAPWLTSLKQPDGSTWYYVSYMCSGTTGTGWREHFGFDICYGRSRNPVMDALGKPGNFTFMGSLQWSPPHDCGQNGACNTQGSTRGDNNHQGIIEFPLGSGQYLFFYHNRKTAQDRGQYNGFQRNVAVDRLYVNWTDGTLLPVTSTPGWMRQLAYIDPYLNHTASELAGATPAVLANPGEGGVGRSLGNFTAGSWVRVAGCDFGASAEGARPLAISLTVRVACGARCGGGGGGSGVTMEVWLAPMGTLFAPTAANGTQVGSCSVPGPTSGWTDVACSITGAVSGPHDLFFVFRGAGGAGALDLSFGSWQFSGGRASESIPTPLTPAIGLLARGGSTGAFVSASQNGSGPLVTVRQASRGATETFIVTDNEDGSYALRSAANGLYVCVDAPSAQLFARASSPTEACAIFRLYGTPDASYALQALAPSSGGLFIGAKALGGTLLVDQADPRTATADAARFVLA